MTGPGSVVWQDVGFAYPDADPVLDGVDLAIAGYNETVVGAVREAAAEALKEIEK